MGIFKLKSVVWTGVFLMGMSFGHASAETLVVNIPTGHYSVDSMDGEFDRIQMDGFGCTFPMGAPRLPSRIVAVAIPPGSHFTGLDVVTGEPLAVPGTFNIQPRSMPRPLSGDPGGSIPGHIERYNQNIEDIYGSDALFPETPATYVRSAGFRKYNLVDIAVCPFMYRPVSGSLMVYPDMQLVVSYSFDNKRTDALEAHLPRVDHSPRMEAQAAEFIINYDTAQAWYPETRDSRGEHEFVIVTTSALVDAVQPLVDIEQTKGRTTYVATTEWINSQYSGRDLEEKIRTFLREKYPSAQWGITDVCLVGHYSDVPMRQVAQDAGYGDPLTDFYYAELSGPDNTAWDSNNNNQWWDSSDSADYYNEVNVGRIPWSNWNTVNSICQKSADFELNNDPVFKSSILFLGSFFWEDTDNAVLMEAIAAEPWMSGWNQYRMYEQNSTVYSSYPCDEELTHANVRSEWPNGTYCFVDWAGHGSPTSAHIMGYGSDAFIDSGDCSLLNDNFPAIIFADACSNSDTDYTNIGAAMLQQGAVGFVGATKVAFGCPGWNDPGDGSSQSLDYYFATNVTSTNHSQGAALQNGLRTNYQNGGWDDNKYEIAEWNLWGNPDLGLVLAISGDGVLSLDHDVYGPNMQLGLTVRDMDLNTNPGSAEATTVTLATSGGSDFETVTLVETGLNTAVFEGLVSLSTSGVTPENGVLEIVHGEAITATYIDADDGHGGFNIPKTVQATVDAVPPIIGNVTVTGATYNQLTIEWDTDEASDSVVYYGTGTPDQQAVDINAVTHHVVTITGLESCTEYNIIVESTDAAANTAADDNGGAYYVFETWELTSILSEDMSSDPGWTTEGDWEWGNPTGSGGQHGNPDPGSGHTGNTVYGYNLNGDYPNNLSQRDLISPAIDCSDASGTLLGFWRWLGVERSMYDHASIRISTNGSNWDVVWENPDVEIADGSWIYQEYDISTYADGQSTVYIKWVMGTTDGGWTYCGWNIDDVEVFSSQPCNPGNTPTPPPTWTPAPTNTPVPTGTIPPTNTPGPSPTPAPTNTPYPTYTAAPTPTPNPSNTPFPTYTPYPTHTPTPSQGTPTWTPTQGPTHTPQPTNTPGDTPTATFTPVPTGTMMPTPTPTAEPDTVTVDLILSQTMFHAGDRFILVCDCFNPGYDTSVDRYIILDVLGSYFFWPSWGQTVEHDTCDLPGGEHTSTEILNFTWPSGINQSVQGIHFWAGLMWPGTNIMAADIASATFGYE